MDYSKLQYPDPSINSVNSVNAPMNEMPSSSMKKELLNNDFNGPIEKRKRTNDTFLILFGIAVSIWFLLSFYCMYHGDLSRLHFKSNNTEFETAFKVFASDVKLSSGEIYISCSAAVVFSAILIVLFRHYAGTIVWFVIGLLISVMSLSTLSLWGIYASEKDTPAKTPSSVNSFSINDQIIETQDVDNVDHSPTVESSSAFYSAIVLTIFTIFLSLLFFALRKHIRMVIRLFKEGGKVANSMPLIIAQPFVTLVALVVACFLGVFFLLWIESSGFNQKDEYGNEVLVKDEIMQFARVYNFLIWLWIVQFFIGCQHMIIAGATATWYFTRDKARVQNALSKSYKYLFKYHLGSVALGSLIITTVQVIRTLYQMALKKNARNAISLLFGCILKYLERLITFLTRNAYIEIAIYGDSFWVSGVRAFTVLTNNAIKVATINSVGDFVMGCGRLLVTSLTVAIGYLLLQNKPGIQNIVNPLIFIGIIAFIVVHSFMLAFEMIVDSIFICFCEDCDINDGDQRPYYMSKEMMAFINQDRQKTLKVGDAAAE